MCPGRNEENKRKEENVFVFRGLDLSRRIWIQMEKVLDLVFKCSGLEGVLRSCVRLGACVCQGSHNKGDAC